MKYFLNDLYLKFKTGKIDRSEFEGSIYNYYLNNQNKTCLSHWNTDEYEDYISWFYKRLRKAIDSYVNTGSSFEAYMAKFMLISSREYRVRVTTGTITEYYTWSVRVPDLYTREEPPVYNYDHSDEILSKLIEDQNGRKSTKRMLALILKCYHYASDDFIEKISPKIGIGKKELKEMTEKIRKLRQKKDDEVYLLKERIYCQFYRCAVYEKRLSLLNENSTARDKLNQKYIRAKKRLENMRKRLSLIRTEATNSQIAEVMGVKKGTVDSSMHKLKVKLNLLSDESFLN